MMIQAMDNPDYIVEISGLKSGESQAPLKPHGGQCGRPWLAILWRCCHVYSRVYRNPQQTAYEGRCPKCGKQATLRIGAGGTSSRFFEAG